MHMTIHSKLAGLLAIASLFIAGCASDVPLETKTPVEVREPVGGTGAGAGKGVTDSPVASVDLTKNDAAANSSGNVVYFDYDSFAVKEEFRPVLESQAQALRANRSKKLRLEGHTDERGGSEYNLALGQKRAQAVLKSLTLLGATDGQLEAVSFGKERPAVQGSDESAYAKNRRVEMVGR